MGQERKTPDGDGRQGQARMGQPHDSTMGCLLSAATNVDPNRSLPPIASVTFGESLGSLSLGFYHFLNDQMGLGSIGSVISVAPLSGTQ